MADSYKDLDDKVIKLLGPYLTSSGANNKGDWRGFCAVHETPGHGSPSAGYNFIKNVWNCMSCGEGGKISTLLKEMQTERKDKTESNVVSIKSGRSPLPLPTQESIDNWHEVLLDSPNKLSYLESRGISLDSVVKFQIGFSVNDSRFMIPVRDAGGNLINVRRYRRDATAKMLPWSEGVPTSIFNAEILKSNEAVVICEGEWDCILLNQLGIPALTTTAGAEGFRPEWAKNFARKTVWICFDADDAGARGTAKVAEILKGIADKVYAIQLDFEADGKDISDFFGAENHEPKLVEFRKAMEEATAEPLWDAKLSVPEIPNAGKLMGLEESQRAASGEVAELYVRVFGKQTPAYIVPKIFSATCSQDKSSVCKACPMRKFDGHVKKEIRIDDPVILKFLESSDNQVNELLRRNVGARCNDRIVFDSLEEVNVEELVVGQSVEHIGEDIGAPYSDTIYSVGSHRTSINTVARVVGRRQADPRTQRGSFQSWLLEPVEEDIDSVSLDREELEELSIFQPDEDQTPLDKCYEIAHDLSTNVTQIFGRDKLHVGYDLAWHSSLGFNFAGKQVHKGWLDIMVIGDTRTGKSEATSRLREHYNAGVITSCEGATLAGLLGGAQQVSGKHWMVTWGVIPRADRRLVVLDEFSGLKDKAVIDELSSVRSEGVARITKIASEETSARTRMIWISNPVDGKTLSESKGMAALRKLVANPEDIARFDYVMAVSNKDVPSKVINSLNRAKVPHEYTAELCRRLILWIWSRRTDQIRIGKAATEAIVAAAEELGVKYVPDPPLVQVENIRIKLARIAVAIAGRTFSTNSTGELIVVRPEHVKSAVDFLDDIYGDEVMGYLKHSQRTLERRKSAIAYTEEVSGMLQRNPKLLTVLFNLQDSGRFRMRDLDDLGGQSPEIGGGSEIAHWLIERNMLSWITGGFLSMEPALIEILSELEN
jgi:5S rRNA maturation endonuclease (ribonuclease M5)